MKKIALLGATGYIGKSLLYEFFDDSEKVELFLFSRSKDKVKVLLKDKPKSLIAKVYSFVEFSLHDYDVVINCTGIGSPVVLNEQPESIFKVTEEIDNMVLAYLSEKPKTLYINLSSGAVYGDNFQKPITKETKTILNINNISEYYSIAKINAEAKHRAIRNLNIVDLRVFAFFSRFVDDSSGFLMSEIINCIKNRKVFKTNNENIVRDYISPKDLFLLIKSVMKKKNINDFFDVYSLKPVKKFELLASLEKKYKLKYSINKASKNVGVLSKKVYYSKDRKLKKIGYLPKLSSLEGIEVEIDKMNI